MMNTKRLSAASLDLQAFKTLIDTPTEKPALAAAMESGVPIYEAGALAGRLEDGPGRAEMLDEWAEVLMHGAGCFAISGATPDGLNK